MQFQMQTIFVLCNIITIWFLKFEKNRETDKFIGKYITSQSLNKFQESNCNLQQRNRSALVIRNPWQGDFVILCKHLNWKIPNSFIKSEMRTDLIYSFIDWNNTELSFYQVEKSCQHLNFYCYAAGITMDLYLVKQYATNHKTIHCKEYFGFLSWGTLIYTISINWQISW